MRNEGRGTGGGGGEIYHLFWWAVGPNAKSMTLTGRTGEVGMPGTLDFPELQSTMQPLLFTVIKRMKKTVLCLRKRLYTYIYKKG
jgi:hypothetical protein